MKNLNNNSQLGPKARPIGRREFLRFGVAAGSLAAFPGSYADAQQSPVTIEALMANAVFNGSLRGILENGANVKINDSPFQSSTDVISRLLAPGGTSRYDLMGSIAAFSRVPILGPKSGEEKVKPVDLSRIPNFSQIADVFKDETISRDGKVYGVPIFWGYDSVVFNRDKVPENDPYTQSWGMLFDDKYAGRIAWQDTAHQTMMAAGLYLGKKQPETMTKAELGEIEKFLIAKKKNVRTIYSSFGQAVDLMASGEVVCLYGPIPVRTELQQKGFNVTNAWCKEGVLSFMTDGYIPKDARNAERAEQIMNLMLGEKFASEISPVCGYLSPSKFGAQKLSAAERSRLGYGILEGTTKNYPLKYPPNLSDWIAVWSRVKAA
jgi:spermidine/putrescine transport system substrate-binding protein